MLGHNAHHGPFVSIFKSDPLVKFSTKHAPMPTHLPYGLSHVSASGALTAHRVHQTDYVEHELLEGDIHRMFDFHLSNGDFDGVDAVVCSHPVSYCEGFMALNKSLILFTGSSR
jgi:hypothetical protein